jgi:FKBP-type peptidyl-prolyl cis-trans isomerase SlyD
MGRYVQRDVEYTPVDGRRASGETDGPLALPRSPSMSIRHDSVVTLHYTLKDAAGEVLDSSVSGEPLTYLHGHGHLVPGLERGLEGRSAGEKLNVKVAPADGYGEYDEKLVERVPRRALKGVGAINLGMQLRAATEDGSRTVTVTRVAGDLITLDGNHPLAGQSLDFEIEITDVRDATEEELAHGHVHGPGGHHH